jgi:hypothetical protein
MILACFTLARQDKRLGNKGDLYSFWTQRRGQLGRGHDKEPPGSSGKKGHSRAPLGYERIQEAQDPEVPIRSAILHYSAQGRTDDWIEKRILTMLGETSTKEIAIKPDASGL